MVKTIILNITTSFTLEIQWNFTARPRFSNPALQHDIQDIKAAHCNNDVAAAAAFITLNS